MGKEKRDLATVADKSFTGVAHTLEKQSHNGFANYTIVTLTIKNGEVVNSHRSQPYAGFEAFAKMEVLNARLLEDLRRSWGGEIRHV